MCVGLMLCFVGVWFCRSRAAIWLGDHTGGHKSVEKDVRWKGKDEAQSPDIGARNKIVRRLHFGELIHKSYIISSQIACSIDLVIRM